MLINFSTRLKSYLLVGFAAGATALALPAPVALAAAPALEAPSAEKIQEARNLIAKMRDNPRGPYSNIQWVCKDGTVLPPKSGACVPYGGGNQFAKFSQDRARLATLGYPVGTIFVALDRGTQMADARPFQRVRDLPLEQYLTDIDDGWVLHKARGYRGRVQIEDEEKAGRTLLLEILADPKLQTGDILLLRELVKVVPHSGAGQDPTREIRRLSQVLAERDPRFEPLRAEIHGKPTQSTVARVKEWNLGRTLSAENTVLMTDLMTELEVIFGEAGRLKRLTAVAKTLRATDPAIADAILDTQKNALVNSVGVLSKIRQRFDLSKSPQTQLTYLDAMTALEAEVIYAARTQANAPASRAEALTRAALLAQAATDLGWLSPTEGAKLTLAAQSVLDSGKERPFTVSPKAYSSVVKDLQLAPAWAQGTVRHTFAEPLTRYTALDSRAGKFVDDLLRGSVLQPLSEATELLTRDDVALSGLQARLMGKTVNALALNPGQATGVLRVLETDSDNMLPRYDPKDIIVIPNTTAELFPAAGIITVGEGNPLSHIQILARNLGIPNIVIDTPLRETLTAYDGQRVNLAATQDGRILMSLAETAKVETGKKMDAPTQISRSGTIPAPVPDLSRKDPIALKGLRANMSGVVVGPKAANIGELSYLFPDRVAPAVALPFGAFAAHTEAGPNAPRLRLKKAFADFDADIITEDAFLTVLDSVRAQTAALTLLPETRKKLETIMTQTLTPGAGVFVRSDTNMEDLPQFTGAGLNLTLPNVTGRDKQLAAISEVWASVYTRRAMAWRSQILSNPDDVFSSILLMESVPSEKSGVMVTTDLSGQNTANALTISVAWGVGGAVDNESAASYILTPERTVLLSEAKAPYQRYLKSAGGVGWKPAPSGPVLTEAEAKDLRALAAEVIARYPVSPDTNGTPLPFDIEFGFANGKLNLLQIRPLVQRGALAAEATVTAVIPKPQARTPVNLQLPLVTAASVARMKKRASPVLYNLDDPEIHDAK